MSRVLLPSLLSLLLLAAGCGGEAAAPTETSAQEPRATRTASPTPSRSPSAKPTPKPTPEQAPPPAPSTPAGSQDKDRKLPPQSVQTRTDASYDHLLTASTLPRLGGQEWRVHATGPERSRPVGACQKTALLDIGALRAVRRDFAGPDDSGVAAHQVVARFADPKSAWRAHEVLRSWRDDCAERLDGSATDVGPMEDVELVAGRGGHYRSTFGTRRHPEAAGLGIVRRGSWLSVVEVSAADDDYPTRWAPSLRAVRRIAATFA